MNAAASLGVSALTRSSNPSVTDRPPPLHTRGEMSGPGRPPCIRPTSAQPEPGGVTPHTHPLPRVPPLNSREWAGCAARDSHLLPRLRLGPARERGADLPAQFSSAPSPAPPATKWRPHPEALLEPASH